MVVQDIRSLLVSCKASPYFVPREGNKAANASACFSLRFGLIRDAQSLSEDLMLCISSDSVG